jgi:hypothetical protein
VLLYAARIQGLDPWLVTSWGRNAPGIEGRSFDRHDVSGNEALAAAAAADRLPVSRLGSFERVTRIAVSGGVPARGELLTSLDFSGIPALVVARASDAVAKSSICPAPRGDGYFSEQHVQHETVGGRRSTFGYGWGPVDREGVRLEQREGELLISLARPRAIDVVLTIVSDGAGATIGLAVNGSAIETRSLAGDQGTYRWTIPAAAWKTGVNRAVVAAPPGLRVRAIDLVATDR